MEVEKEVKLGVLRAEQHKLNTAILKFAKSVQKAREATESFGEKIATLQGKLVAAKNREKCLPSEYQDK